MLEDLKKRVYEANLLLINYNLAILTWGNVSEISKDRKYVVIKPSGVDYSLMQADDMVVVDLFTGKIIEGTKKPSSDTQTHLEIYRSFKSINSICHTHSTNAVAFAQAGIDIEVIGTTQADYFCGNVPCTRVLSEEEVGDEYELNTGKVIVETLKKNNINPLVVPAVNVRNHGPFVFGLDAKNAVENAYVLEKVSEINIKTLFINNNSSIPQYLLAKHYNRKHGKGAYYGQ